MSTKAPTPNALFESTTVTLDSAITQDSTPVNQAAFLNFFKKSADDEKQDLLKLLANTGGPYD